MMGNNYYDDILRNEIKANMEEIKADRDLFNEAWRKKELSERKYERRNFNMRKVKVVALALGLCISLGVISFGVSPKVRATVSSLFNIDKYGNVVEESLEDEGYINSSIHLDDDNKEQIENLIGFKINHPERVGKYIINGNNGQAYVSVTGVKNKDIYSVEESIRSADNYIELKEELSKDYDVKFNIFAIYIDTSSTEDNKLITIGQKVGNKVTLSDRSTEKEVKNIDGIECTVYDYITDEGNKVVTKNDEGLITSINTDMTKKPYAVKKSGLSFSYNGYVYDIKGDSIEDEIQFAKEYIKTLK